MKLVIVIHTNAGDVFHNEVEVDPDGKRQEGAWVAGLPDQDVAIPWHNPLGVIPDVLDTPEGEVREYGVSTPNSADAQGGMVACYDPDKPEFRTEPPELVSPVPVTPTVYADPDAVGPVDPPDPEPTPEPEPVETEPETPQDGAESTTEPDPDPEPAETDTPQETAEPDPEPEPEPEAKPKRKPRRKKTGG